MFAAFTRIRSPHCSGEEKQTSNFLYRLAGIAESEAVRGNVARHDAARTYHAAVAYRDTGKHDHIAAEPYVIP